MCLVPMLDEDYKIIKKNGQPIMIEVSQEVHDFMVADRKAHNRYKKELERKLLFFDLPLWESLKCFGTESAEASYFTHSACPSDTKALAATKEVLATCTEKQRRRFTMYLSGLTHRQIAQKEHVHLYAVQYAINKVIEKIQKAIKMELVK